MSVPNWVVLQPSTVGVYGPQQVVVYDRKNYDTLVIASNNSNTAATSTVSAMSTLAKYYQSQGVTTRVYGLSAASGTNMTNVLNSLGWTTAQCNPIIGWVRNGQIDPITYSRSKQFTSADLDMIIRANSRHDPLLDSIPPMDGPTTASVSRFDAMVPSQWTSEEKTRVFWLILALIVVYYIWTSRKTRNY